MTRNRAILVVVVVFAMMIGSAFLFRVPLPHIQLPAEWIPGTPLIHIPLIGPFYITNTVIAILTTDLLLLVLAFLATRNLSMVPSGMQNVFEMIIEMWHGLSVDMIGEERTKRWLPLVLTIFLLVIGSNWVELIPGYDTIGVLCAEEACRPESEEHQVRLGVPAVAFAQGDDSGADALGAGDETSELGVEAAVEGEGEGAAGEATLFVADRSMGPFVLATRRAEPGEEGYEFVPFFRVAASDLNFTLALALIVFVAIEIVGFKALGLRYADKFIAVSWIPGFIRGKGGHSRIGLLANGLLAVLVGILEVISELARIISFSFRLFGNMFAGQILLFVIPFLIPFLAVVPVYGLELFVGAIQAFVFAILTLAFMSAALITHEEH